MPVGDRNGGEPGPTAGVLPGPGQIAALKHVGAQNAEIPATALTDSAPVMTAAPAAQRVSDSEDVLQSLLRSWSGPGGQVPGEAVLSWTLLAAARRELGRTQAAAPATTVDTGEPPTGEPGAVTPPGPADQPGVPPAAAAEADERLSQATGVPTAAAESDPVSPLGPIEAIVDQIRQFVSSVVSSVVSVVTEVIRQVSAAISGLVDAIVAIFNPEPPPNTAPLAGAPAVGSPDPASGVVTGQVTGSDPNGDTLSYTASATTTKGAVSIDAANGTFTYTPTAAARHAAAKTDASPVEKTDTFTVTVSDGRGGTATATVTVVIAAANTAPATGTVNVGEPDATTGVVTGTVSATDADNDTLTYGGSTTTSKGTVDVAADGTFTYTPAAAARHTAARTGAPVADLSDSFTVAVTDGYGGTTAIPVSVVISPTNTAPVAGTVAVGTPNDSTGVVTGRVSATDADNDTLDYSGSTTTAKGSVDVAADGTFTYTPTAAARHAAAKTDASPADKADSFTVTVTDGYGGTTSVAVNVVVAGTNTAPAVSTPTVGEPDVTTGVVTGRVFATDADNDTLTYSGSTITAKGTVGVAVDGTFTYTPTAAARHTAANLNATTADKTDSFTVTVTDGYGGMTAIPVNVGVSPSNHAPAVAVVGVLNDDGSTTITVTSSDADGDTVTLTASSANGDGTLTPTADGYTYIPSPTSVSDTDVVTVTGTDGYGGVTSSTLSVNATPVVITPQITSTVTGSDPDTGSVAGTLTATGLSGGQVSYTLSSPVAAPLGQVSLDEASGQWTYTPSLVAALAAWLGEPGADTATFDISATDGQVSTTATVTVPVQVPTETLIGWLETLGSAPSAIAAGPDGRLFITDSGANTVTFLSPSDGSKNTITVGRTPVAVAIGSDGTVWIANSGDNTVTVLDANGATLSAAIPVGAVPAAIALGADGTAYVINTGDSTVSVIGSAYAVTATLTVGDVPTGITAGDDGKIYVTNYADGTVSIIDPTNANTVTTLAAGTPNPYGITIGTDGRLYLTDPLADTLTILQPTEDGYTNSSLTIANTPTAITLAPDGLIYITNTAANTITIVDPAFIPTQAATARVVGAAFNTASPTTTLTVGDNPLALTLTPDGTLYTLNTGTNTLTTTNTQTGNTTTTNIATTTSTITTGYNGELLITNNYNRALTVLPRSTIVGPAYAAKALTAQGGFCCKLAAGPDGVYVASFGYFTEYVQRYNSAGEPAGFLSMNVPTAQGGISKVVAGYNGEVYVLNRRGIWVDEEPNDAMPSRYLPIDAYRMDMALGPNGNLYVMSWDYLYDSQGRWTGDTNQILMKINPNDGYSITATALPGNFSSYNHPVTGYADGMAVGSDGKVYFAMTQGVSVFDPGTGNYNTLDYRNATAVAVGRDGRVYLGRSDGLITVINADHTSAATVATGLPTIQFMQMSSDEKLYLSHYDYGSGSANVAIVDPRNYALSTVQAAKYGDGDPRYRIDGVVALAAGPSGVFASVQSCGPGACTMQMSRISQFRRGASSVPGDPSPKTTTGLLDRIATDIPDQITVEKVVDSGGVTRMVVYMSGVRGDIAGPGFWSGWAARLAMNGWTDPKMASFIDQYKKEWNPQEIMLVGFSKGGMTAQNYASNHRDKVTTIVTFAAPLVRNASEYTAHALHIQASNDKVPMDTPWWGIGSGQITNPEARKSLNSNLTDNKSIYLVDTGNSYSSNAHGKENYILAARAFESEAFNNPNVWGTLTADIKRFSGEIVETHTTVV